MAPLPPRLKKPSARSFRQQRLAGAVHPLAPLKTFRPDAAPLSDDFASTKRDKRLMKHSTFMSRVVTSGGVAKKTKTKQQPSTTTNNNNKRTGRGRTSRSKLATTLEGLADALPALQDGEGDLAALQGRVRHKSISSKRGALRRKERVVRGEMERFGVSMAQLAQQQQQQQGNTTTTTTTQTATTMTTGQGSEQGQQQGEPVATSSRWAALRGYISSTMEQNPAFVGRQ